MNQLIGGQRETHIENAHPGLLVRFFDWVNDFVSAVQESPVSQVKTVWLMLLGLSLQVAHAADNSRTSVHRPKLILAIAIDQFRYDYTTRFRDRYVGGLATMLSHGAVFVDAHQDHFPTVTATGHATFLSGSVPATSGIIGNEWYDRASGKTITSVEDGHVLNQVAKPFLESRQQERPSRTISKLPANQ